MKRSALVVFLLAALAVAVFLTLNRADTQVGPDVITSVNANADYSAFTVSAEPEALSSFAEMAQGLKPWLVQEQPSLMTSNEPCFASVSGAHYGGSDHREPFWGQSCILTFNGGQPGQGEFGPVEIEVAREPPDCTDSCPHAGALGYCHALMCGSLTTYCVFEENPVCPNYMVPAATGMLGQTTRDAIQWLLAQEPRCGDPNGNGIDDFQEVFDLSGPIPVPTCLSPRVFPVFVGENWLNPEIHPKTYYIYHFAVLYLEGCMNTQHPTLDVKCGDPGNFQTPGQTQLRVRFGEMISGALTPTPTPTPGVPIDIKPGSYPNSINPGSKGVIAVAILTTEDFDAATVDPDTVLFGPGDASVETKGGGKLKAATKDVDHDSDLDLIMHFRTQDTGIAPGDTEACLTGETYDGVPIWGCDSVRTVPPEADDDGDSHGTGLPRIFGDDIEASLRTDQQEACPDDLNDDAWPPDLNNDTVVNVLDLLLFRGRLMSTLGDSGYEERFDLSFDGSIDVVDVVTMKPFVNTSCTNP